jgi:hypothetical protein
MLETVSSASQAKRRLAAASKGTCADGPTFRLAASAAGRTAATESA